MISISVTADRRTFPYWRNPAVRRGSWHRSRCLNSWTWRRRAAAADGAAGTVAQTVDRTAAPDDDDDGTAVRVAVVGAPVSAFRTDRQHRLPPPMMIDSGDAAIEMAHKSAFSIYENVSLFLFLFPFFTLLHTECFSSFHDDGELGHWLQGHFLFCLPWYAAYPLHTHTRFVAT